MVNPPGDAVGDEAGAEAAGVRDVAVREALHELRHGGERRHEHAELAGGDGGDHEPAPIEPALGDRGLRGRAVPHARRAPAGADGLAERLDVFGGERGQDDLALAPAARRLHVDADDDYELAAADELLAGARVCGGSARVERRPESLRERVAAWGDGDAPGLFLMRRIKSEFDPNGILEPGRGIVR